VPSLKGLGIICLLPGTAVPGYSLLRPFGTGEMSSNRHSAGTVMVTFHCRTTALIAVAILAGCGVGCRTIFAVNVLVAGFHYTTGPTPRPTSGAVLSAAST